MLKLMGKKIFTILRSKIVYVSILIMFYAMQLLKRIQGLFFVSNFW